LPHLTPEGARPLVGDQFWQANTQKTVGDLLKFVSTNMPNGRDAGSLSASSYNDLVALILKSNGFPAGATEVSPDTVASIQIIPKDGPWRAAGQHAGARGRVPGAQERRRLDDHQLPRRPLRVDKGGVGADDPTRALGDRTMALKFVLSRLDANVGKRVSVERILLGAGGADGINVVERARASGDTCPLRARLSVRAPSVRDPTSRLRNVQLDPESAF
jgi:hypothetical protein